MLQKRFLVILVSGFGNNQGHGGPEKPRNGKKIERLVQKRALADALNILSGKL